MSGRVKFPHLPPLDKGVIEPFRREVEGWSDHDLIIMTAMTVREVKEDMKAVCSRTDTLEEDLNDTKVTVRSWKAAVVLVGIIIGIAGTAYAYAQGG